MKKELAIKQIFDDFVDKTILTENEKEILTRYIKGESIIRMAEETSQSTATVSNAISRLKDKYVSYKRLELVKLSLLK